jgi:hypothetical protein
MHGMLSATILICVFAVVALSSLYLVLRVHLAGTHRGPDAGPGQEGR